MPPAAPCRAGTVVDNKKKKKVFFEDVNSKRRTKENIGLLLDDVGHLLNRDEDKAETFHAAFTPVFNTSDGPWDPVEPMVGGPQLGE